MHGGQGRSARQVDGHRGTLQAKCERDAAGGHAARRTKVAKLDLCGFQQVPVFAGANSREYSRPASSQPLRVDTGVLESLPTRLEQHPLLRVYRSGLYRRNAEEPRVEPVDTIDKRASSTHYVLGIRVAGDAVPGAGVLASLRNGLGTRFNQFPI